MQSTGRRIGTFYLDFMFVRSEQKNNNNNNRGMLPET